MRVSDYDTYRTMLRDMMGLDLSPRHAFLVDARLTPVARKWGHPSLQALALALRAMPEPELLDDIAEAMVNMDTCFFRDGHPFTDLAAIAVPALMQTRARQRRLRIWSCGCGTGQEAWSLAIALKNMRPALTGWNIEIWATDLSSAALAVAENATYAQHEVQRGLSVHDLVTWCEPVGKQWRMKDELRALVDFDQLNIATDPLPPERSFDIIMFRHVMDDFESALRAEILEGLAGSLADDGFMLLGPAENPDGLYDGLMPLPDHPGLFVIAE